MSKSFILIILVSFVIYVLSAQVLPRIVKVAEISCRNQYGPCTQYFKDNFSKITGKSLKETKALVTSQLTHDVGVSNFSLQYKFPNILVVNIIEEKAVFALKNAVLGSYAILTQDGSVIRIENSTNLPFVEITERPPNVGEKASDKELFALKILLGVNVSYQVKRGVIEENDSLVIELPTGLSVIFPLEGDRDLLLGSLVAVFDRLNGSSKESKIDSTFPIKVIDLRFKNPVLR